MFTMKEIINLDITLMLVLYIYIYIPLIKYKGNLHTNEVDIVYFYKKFNLGCIFDRAKF